MGAGARTRAAVALVAAAALCSGCALQDRVTLPVPLPTDVPFAYHLQTESGGDGALLEGTLELQDGCLVVLTSYEGLEDLPPEVPVLPIAVTTWDGTTLTVEGEATDVGDEIALGGGFSASPGSAGYVPDSCHTEDDDDGRYFYVGIYG